MGDIHFVPEVGFLFKDLLTKLNVCILYIQNDFTMLVCELVRGSKF